MFNRTSSQRMRDVAGTALFSAPEVGGLRTAHGYTHKCDLWSIGVVTYFLLSGESPFEDDRELHLLNGGELRFPAKEWRQISGNAKMIIRELLSMEDCERPEAYECLASPWITQYKNLMDELIAKF